MSSSGTNVQHAGAQARGVGRSARPMAGADLAFSGSRRGERILQLALISPFLGFDAEIIRTIHLVQLFEVMLGEVEPLPLAGRISIRAGQRLASEGRLLGEVVAHRVAFD